jgi:large subunit ribosomal protein L18
MYAGIIMSLTNPRAVARIKRKARIRKKITGTSDQPRMSVFRSARHVYAQIIDDTTGVTLATASSVEKGFKEQDKFENKKAAATYVGKLIAERALEKGIKKVVFDRNGFLYHGRVKALSDGARKAGLKL